MALWRRSYRHLRLIRSEKLQELCSDRVQDGICCQRTVRYVNARNTVASGKCQSTLKGGDIHIVAVHGLHLLAKHMNVDVGEVHSRPPRPWIGARILNVELAANVILPVEQRARCVALWNGRATAVRASVGRYEIGEIQTTLHMRDTSAGGVPNMWRNKYAPNRQNL